MPELVGSQIFFDFDSEKHSDNPPYHTDMNTETSCDIAVNKAGEQVAEIWKGSAHQRRFTVQCAMPGRRC